MNPKIILKPKKEESLGRFHPWVFSGAVKRSEGQPEEGDVVDIISAEGKFLARGHCQIGSIAVRVLTFEDEAIDQAWWHGRLAAALALRETLGLVNNPWTDCYRLVHGEGDFLPGLIIDIYGSVAVIQCHSVGMYLARHTIAQQLAAVMEGRLTAIYDKSSQTVPFNAGLDAVDGYLFGKSASGETTVSENGIKFLVSPERGQKTGFFLDQRDNRTLLTTYCKGKKVLNTFCYTGGFSAYALAGGATHVDSMDSSAQAVEMAVRNIELNFGAEAPHRGITADAIDYVKTMGRDYDVIVLDPPAFAKHRDAIPNALKGYRRLNARAIESIRPGGVIFTFSCSQAISRDMFRTSVFTAAASTGRRVRILHQLTQPADHPVSIYHPEGEYLKGLVIEVE